MLRRILVGLDGSPQSLAATDLAVRWAREAPAQVLGLGIVDEEGVGHGEPVPLGASAFKKHRDETLLADARHRIDAVLAGFTAQCQEGGVSSHALHLAGSPAQEIIRYSQRADLVVLGTVTHFQDGSRPDTDDNLAEILKNGSRPVVAVPMAPVADGPIVIAYDGSLQAARTLQLFQLLELGRQREIHVIAVASHETDAQRWLAAATEYLRSHDVDAQLHAAVTQQSAAATLLDEVRKLHASLLVMGAYGQPAVREFFLGSVTHSLLRDTPVPLFLYH